jgi:hypothetical protein
MHSEQFVLVWWKSSTHKSAWFEHFCKQQDKQHWRAAPNHHLSYSRPSPRGSDMRVFHSVLTNLRFVLFLASYQTLHASITTLHESLNDAEAVGTFTSDARAGTQGLRKEPTATAGRNNLAPLNVPNSGQRSSYLNTPPLKELQEKMRIAVSVLFVRSLEDYDELSKR